MWDLPLASLAASGNNDGNSKSDFGNDASRLRVVVSSDHLATRICDDGCGRTTDAGSLRLPKWLSIGMQSCK